MIRFRPRFNLGTRLTLRIGTVIGLTSLALFLGIYRLQEQQVMSHLETQARALLTEMVVLREWVAVYGGVWTTRPGDFYLDSRDGFYRKSPAMVTKELSRLSDTKGYYRFHITSLRLKNPENAPDAFERQALHGFEQDAMPVSRVEVMDGTHIYRMMLPLKAEAPCLECHGDQGYQVGDIRGGLSVLVPMSDTDRALAENFRALTLSAAVIVILVMAVLYVLVRHMIVKPVSQLKAVAMAVGQGDYTVRSHLHTGDELEMLGQTFNQMVASLKTSRDALQSRVEQRTQELAALSDVALTISQAGALEDVLNEGLNTVLKVTRADGGAVHLAEEQDSLRLVVWHDLPGEVLACLDSIRPGESFVGRVVQTGEALHAPDLSDAAWQKICPRPTCPACTRGYRALAVIPLQSRNRTLGALTLLRQTPEAFSPETVQLLTCIGCQLGVAVENARFREQVEQVAILEERGRIARELHDSLAQTLGWLNLKTEMLADSLDRGEIEKAQTEVAAIRRVVREAGYDVRESIDGLRIRPAEGLVPTAAAWVSEFGRRSGLLTEFRAADSEVRLPPVVESEMLRILQEALTNVRKHAQARQVQVSLRVNPARAELIVEDDGRGFVYAGTGDGPHFGLRIMRERAERLGGTLSVETAPGRGTRIVAYLPRYPVQRSERA